MTIHCILPCSSRVKRKPQRTEMAEHAIRSAASVQRRAAQQVNLIAARVSRSGQRPKTAPIAVICSLPGPIIYIGRRTHIWFAGWLCVRLCRAQPCDGRGIRHSWISLGYPSQRTAVMDLARSRGLARTVQIVGLLVSHCVRVH